MINKVFRKGDEDLSSSLPIKMFYIFTLAFIVLITQHALFIKKAIHTVMGSKLPFKLKC